MSEYASSSFPDVVRAHGCMLCIQNQGYREVMQGDAWLDPARAQFHYAFSLKLNFRLLHLQKPLILVKISVTPMLSYSIPYRVTALCFRS